MKKDRVLLEKNLQAEIEQLKHSRKMMYKINHNLSEQGVPLSTINMIAKGDIGLSSLDQSLICALAVTLHKLTENDAISPSEYFTDKELTFLRVNGINLPASSAIMLPLIFEDVIMINYDHYLTKIKMSYLVEMFHSQLITYDYETQRSAKFRRGADGVVPVPDINKKSVEDISSHMLNATYLEDMITLNVYSESLDALEYSSSKRILTLREGSVISILDGFHRLQAGIRTLALNPELQLEMILSIRSYDTETAKKYFGQINTINRVRPERIKELKAERYSDIVVKELQMKSDLKGKIASASRISAAAGHQTTFDILSYAVDKAFKPLTTFEAKGISIYLISFFNHLIGNFPEYFLDITGANNDNLMNHPLMFAGYVQLARCFRDQKREWDELPDCIAKLNVQDPLLRGPLLNTRGNNDSRNRDAIMKYFKTRSEADV